MSDIKGNGVNHPISTKSVFEVLFAPLVGPIQKKRARYSEMINDAIMGECMSREVKPGVWEHTFTPPVTNSLGTFIPQLWTEALTRSTIRDLEQTSWWRTYSAKQKRTRARHKRERRQHRAAFRRRKRGLA